MSGDSSGFLFFRISGGKIHIIGTYGRAEGSTASSYNYSVNLTVGSTSSMSLFLDSTGSVAKIPINSHFALYEKKGV